MSKKQKEHSGAGKQTSAEKVLIPVKYQHGVALGLIILSLFIFFSQMIFSGKIILDADTVSSHSFDTFLADSKSEGVFPLWNPYIFCGYPAYGSLTVAGDRYFDISGTIMNGVSQLFGKILFHPQGWIIFFYVIFGCNMYFFTFYKLRNKIAAFLASIAATYSMYIIIWIMTSHNTKIAVMAFFPLILLAVEKTRERFSLIWAIGLVLLFHFIFIPAHVQMIFYIFLALGIYFLLFVIDVLRKKEHWKSFVRTVMVVAVAGVLAFAMDADKYLSVWTYNPYSIRGASPITQQDQASAAKTAEGGLGYDYATDWSFPPGELLTWIAPSWYGFGYQNYTGPLTNNTPRFMNFYFGGQPFTHAPQYMGIIVLILAGIGLFAYRNDRFVQFAGVLSAFSLFIAFGKELPIIYDLMYNYFPYFNKFRVPSMILVLIQIFVPILAAYGIAAFFSLREGINPDQIQKAKKRILYGSGLAVIVGILMMLTYEGFAVRAAQGRIPAQYIQVLSSEMSRFVNQDLIFAFLYLVLTFGAAYLFIQNKLKISTFTVLVIVVILVDLWRVAYKPYNPVEQTEQQNTFTVPEHAKVIMKDSSQFRILELEQDKDGRITVPYNNKYAYWRLQSAGGYQGAKMRAYQDFVDVAGIVNPLSWQLMNVKYVITNAVDTSGTLGLVYNGRDGKVYQNLSYLPRAFFVKRYEVADGLTILNTIAQRSFDPTDVAYVMEDPKIQIQPPHAAAKAELVHYSPHRIEYSTSNDGTNLLFLSETYYPEGWTASIDGKETPIYRLNYLFRGVAVPPGIHKLELTFDPGEFTLGKTISLLANFVVIGGIGFIAFGYWQEKKGKGTSAKNESA